MSTLVPRAGSAAAIPDGFSRTEGKQLQAATNREIAHGIVANTRLSVANFVTTTAMNHTANLARQAYALADGDEWLAQRLGALVDGYVIYARDEVQFLRRLA